MRVSPPVAEHISRFLKAKAAAVSGFCRAESGLGQESVKFSPHLVSGFFCLLPDSCLPSSSVQTPVARVEEGWRQSCYCEYVNRIWICACYAKSVVVSTRKEIGHCPTISLIPSSAYLSWSLTFYPAAKKTKWEAAPGSDIRSENICSISTKYLRGMENRKRRYSYYGRTSLQEKLEVKTWKIISY